MDKEVYGAMAQDVYATDRLDIGPDRVANLPFTFIVSYADQYHTVYKSDNIIVFAVRGTKVSDKNDLRADVGILLNKLNKQKRYLESEQLLRLLIKERQETHSHTLLHICGHSLGGSICIALLKAYFNEIDMAFVFSAATSPLNLSLMTSLSCKAFPKLKSCKKKAAFGKKIKYYTNLFDPIAAITTLNNLSTAKIDANLTDIIRNPISANPHTIDNFAP